MKLPYRIPTLVGFLAVFIVLASLTFISKRVTLPFLSNVQTLPQDIQISNISDTQATVTWTTDEAVVGTVTTMSGFPSTQPVVFYDDRHVEGTINPFTAHIVTIRSLAPQTTYTVQLLHNNRPVSNAEVTFTTAAPLSESENASNMPPSAFGQIMSPSGTPADDALVILTFSDSQTLSTVTKPSGSWLLPLGNLRTEDMLEAYILNAEQRVPVTIDVYSTQGNASIITDTKNLTPVPEVTLGKSYDFRNQEVTNRVSDLSSVLGTTAGTGSATLNTPVEGATITTQYPRISGQGKPGSVVSMILGISNPITETTLISDNGTFEYAPKHALSPGKSRVIATIHNTEGIPQAFTRSFTILKSGSQVLGDATPSGTPILHLPTPTDLPDIEIIPTLEASPTPTLPETGGTTNGIVLIVTFALGLSLGGFSLLYVTYRQHQ